MTETLEVMVLFMEGAWVKVDFFYHSIQMVLFSNYLVFCLKPLELPHLFLSFQD